MKLSTLFDQKSLILFFIIFFAFTLFTSGKIMSQVLNEKGNEEPTQLLKTQVPSSANAEIESFYINTSNLQNRITNVGAFSSGGNETSGIWPAYSNNSYLYYAGIWIGARFPSGNIAVSQFHRHQGRLEWRPTSEITISSDVSDQDTKTSYWDMDESIPDHTPLGIEVEQRTYAWNGKDFIVHIFKITNTGLYNKLTDLYVGMYWDFDISSAAGGRHHLDDMTGYYAPNYISYMFDGDNPEVEGDDTGEWGVSNGYIGITTRGIYPPKKPRSHKSWASGEDAHNDFERYDLLQNGILDPPSGQPKDYRILQSVGPYTIKANRSIIVEVILGIGANKKDLKETITRAQLAKVNNNLLGNLYEGKNSKNKQEVISKLDIYPNPFNPLTTIQYTLPRDSKIEIVVYNYLGQKIKTLINGLQTAGEYHLKWQPKNIPSGVYIITLKTGDLFKTRRVVYIK